MQQIDRDAVHARLQSFVGHQAFIHLETTMGAYAEGSMGAANTLARGAFIRNAYVKIQRATLQGEGPCRAGVQIELGWIYAEGLTHWEIDDQNRLLLAGLDSDGRLAIAFELSNTPFPV